MAKIEGSDLIYEGWGRFLMLRVRRDDGSEITHQVDDHGDGVAVLPYDPARRMMMLTRQVRPPLLLKGEQRMLLELPAGRLETDNPEQCARREVLEEVGLKIERLEHIGTFWVCPATSTERVHIYLGAYSSRSRVSPGGGSSIEDEQITVEELPIASIAKMAERGELEDVKVFSAVQAFRIRYPALCL